MPMYEYYCDDCRFTFETLRPFAKANAPTDCPSCHEPTSRRMVSRFAAISRSSAGESRAVAGSGNGCGGCSSHSCGSCGHHH